MFNSLELPDIFHHHPPILICPTTQTPNHSLYLSNLDDQKFLRFSIKYLYVFEKSVNPSALKNSLARVLVDYYPLAGRLRATSTTQDDQKLEINCNGEGALFVEASMDITSQEFLQLSTKPNRSWRKLLYRVDSHNFLGVPPLVVQVTNLRCGGMILGTAINHCLCDGVGSSQFLHAWAHLMTEQNHHLPTLPVHSRHVLRPRDPPKIPFTHLQYTKNSLGDTDNINRYLQAQPLVPTSFNFTPSHLLKLKRQCIPSFNCTTFEALASHTWRSWVRSLDLSPSLNVKLLFSVNVRKRMIPEIEQGYYGNGFVLACAGTRVKDLLANNLYYAVGLIQKAKSNISGDYVRSLIDLLEDKTVRTDLATSLVISQWAKLGLEDLDFGQGKAIHMGPLTSDIYCLFLPVAGDVDTVRVSVSMPENVAVRFAYYMQEFWDHAIQDNNNISSLPLQGKSMLPCGCGVHVKSTYV